MSSKARRLTADQFVEAYDWNGTLRSSGPSFRSTAPQPLSYATVAPGAPVAPAAPAVDTAAIEREAFAQGFAQGERAGVEAAAARSEGVLRRLSQTIDELQALRSDMVHKTERQVVQLAIAMAKRIVHREVSLDQDLLMAMARVALDRLGESANATIRLHPEDYAATAASRSDADVMGAVRIVADSAVRRGGCLVQSDFGLIDVSADAQIQELAATLLGAEANAELQTEGAFVAA